MLAAQRHGELFVFEQRELGGVELGHHFIERAIHGIDWRERVNTDFLVGL
jgi:hypothetical protein